MLLLRDERSRAVVAALCQAHTAATRSVFAGEADLVSLQLVKLAATLQVAVHAPLYSDRLTLTGAAMTLAEMLAPIPMLSKMELGAKGSGAFTRATSEFLHYYESSGTTGDPLPAPKALDDLSANTINIGEMWSRVVKTGDTALILINAPFAPAAYQFEKVLEYLGVMSLRPWVDNITGDYSRLLRLTEQLNANIYVGPPSRLLEMVQFAVRNGLRLPRFERLLLMAEQTGPSFLRHLERITGAVAYVGCYGSSETGTTAVTCEHRHLHLQMQSYVFELKRDGVTSVVSLQDGGVERGELVVTTLDMPSRPLLRYETGDLVEVSYDWCPCGVRLPVLRTQGRAQDVLVLEQTIGLRQNDLERALWDEPLEGATVFNYMVVVRDDQVVLLVTTSAEPGSQWASILATRLRPLFPSYRLVVRPVDVLPPLASLGQYLGWKLSRVLDLNDEKNWTRLPEPINALVIRTLEDIGQEG